MWKGFTVILVISLLTELSFQLDNILIAREKKKTIYTFMYLS